MLGNKWEASWTRFPSACSISCSGGRGSCGFPGPCAVLNHPLDVCGGEAATRTRVNNKLRWSLAGAPRWSQRLRWSRPTTCQSGWFSLVFHLTPPSLLSFQYYFTISFTHENQKALELRTEDVKDCDEWVAAISHAR